MKITDKIQLVHGNSLLELKAFAENSVDSIVTDPPYEYGFMGKSWDSTGIAYNIDLWRECLRVLKPGGYIMAFGSSRTHHRLMVAIEDAGFEIRDTVCWVFGCLSDDTEILTKNGWEQYRISKKSSIFAEQEILIYDAENDLYKWETPKKWNEYNIHKDTAYRIKSDTTDQIVSRNHRCLVEREGKLVFVKAEQLDKMEFVPILSSDILSKGKGQSEVLQPSMQRSGTWSGMESTRTQRKRCLVGGNQRELQVEPNRSEQPSVEGWFNIHETQGQICRPINKIFEMSEGVYTNGEKGRLCNGTQTECCKGDKKTINTDGMRTSHKPRCNGQQNRELNAIQNECRPQEVRTRTSYNTTLATVEPIEYSGVIFCPTVSTGAFVARRNGKIFLTGNSGFPKSLNIGKKIDQLQGNEREDLGESENNRDRSNHEYNSVGNVGSNARLTKGTSDFEGWGTALKPAVEYICMARKPLSEKTVAQNCLKWGTGGINIDESRVECNENRPLIISKSEKSENAYGDGLNGSKAGGTTTNARFPANLIHDNSEEVRECFPESKSTPYNHKLNNNNIFGKYNFDETKGGYEDSGNASRFFKSIIYQAKPSKAERNRGCETVFNLFEQSEGVEEKETKVHIQQSKGRKNQGTNKGFKVANNHPTVKPIALMEYLIKMVTPKGGIVLDPFNGSGSTGCAAAKNGFGYIGIDMTEDYIKISEKRIKAYLF